MTHSDQDSWNNHNILGIVSATAADQEEAGRSFAKLEVNEKRTGLLLAQLLALISADAIGIIFGIYCVIFVQLLINNLLPEFFRAIHQNLIGHLSLTAVFLIMTGWLEGYRHRWSATKEFRNVAKAVVAVLVFDLLLRILFSIGIPQAEQRWYLALWLGIFVSVLIWRRIVVGLLTAFGLWERTALIVGTGPNAAQLEHFLGKSKRYNVHVVGFVRVAETTPVHPSLETRPIGGLEWLNRLPSYGRLLGGPDVFVALEPHELPEFAGMVNEMALLGAHCTVVIPSTILPVDSTELIHIAHSDYLALSVSSAKSLWRRMVKRTVDILGASVLLVLLSPLMLGIAVMIWSRDGTPVIYRQDRRGRGGEPFTFLKFRSMYLDADEQLAKWEAENNALYQEYVANNFKLANDPRIIPGGQFLRKTSADELPQLINVLLGQMSLVGPRPVLPREVPHYEGGTFYYDLVHPGITGLWQVSGRSKTQFHERAQLDRSYVINWSLWTDIVILLSTFKAVVTRAGAH